MPAFARKTLPAMSGNTGESDSTGSRSNPSRPNNSIDENVIKKGQALLTSIRPYITEFNSSEYINELANGDICMAVGWSGDISQLALDNPDVRFAIPEEGGMQWSDTMVLPAGAKNVDNAAAWMDYIYDPENAALITEYVGYNSPVAGVQEILAAGDDLQKALSESSLLFPDDDTLSRLHVFASLDEEAEAAFEERFATIIGA